MGMQLEQFVCARSVDTDLGGEDLEVLAFELVDFACDPQPFGLVQPFDQHGFAELPDALVVGMDALATGAAFPEQLTQ
jgi:hypothetical protein